MRNIVKFTHKKSILDEFSLGVYNAICVLSVSVALDST